MQSSITPAKSASWFKTKKSQSQSREMPNISRHFNERQGVVFILNLTHFIVGILAVWRITHAFHAEDGPWSVLAKFRTLFGTSVIGQMMDCFYCLSLWVALGIAYVLAPTNADFWLIWPALSGGACLLHRATEKTMPTISYHEEELSP